MDWKRWVGVLLGVPLAALMITAAVPTSYIPSFGGVVLSLPVLCTDSTSRAIPSSWPFLCQRQITLQQYGAAGDGTTDDTAAVRVALAAGRPVICDGAFVISGTVQVSIPLDTTFSMRGGSKQGCKLKMTTAISRLEVDLAGVPTAGYDRRTPQVVMDNVYFEYSAGGLLTGHATPIENSALGLVFATGNDATGHRVYLHNVQFHGTSASTWAKYGVYLFNGRGTIMDNIECQGATFYFYDAGSACVYINGSGASPTNPSDIPENVHLTNIRSFNNEYGVYGDNHIEGLIVDDSEFVSNRVGVNLSPGQVTTLLQVAHNEFNVTGYGVNAINVVRLQVHDNHMIQLGGDDGTEPACVAIGWPVVTAASSKGLISIHDNICEGYTRTVAGGRKRYGIQVNGNSLAGQNMLATIHDNIFSVLERGIYLGPTTRGVEVGCNVYEGITDTNIYSAAPENAAGQENFQSCAKTALFAGNSTGQDSTWKTQPFARAPTCNGTANGTHWRFSDATVTSGTITGGGSTQTDGVCNGTAWKVTP